MFTTNASTTIGATTIICDASTTLSPVPPPNAHPPKMSTSSTESPIHTQTYIASTQPQIVKFKHSFIANTFTTPGPQPMQTSLAVATAMSALSLCTALIFAILSLRRCQKRRRGARETKATLDTQPSLAAMESQSQMVGDHDENTVPRPYTNIAPPVPSSSWRARLEAKRRWFLNYDSATTARRGAGARAQVASPNPESTPRQGSHRITLAGTVNSETTVVSDRHAAYPVAPSAFEYRSDNEGRPSISERSDSESNAESFGEWEDSEKMNLNKRQTVG